MARLLWRGTVRGGRVCRRHRASRGRRRRALRRGPDVQDVSGAQAVRELVAAQSGRRGERTLRRRDPEARRRGKVLKPGVYFSASILMFSNN